ncbi:hypothetical protein IW01_12540 [Pectobacterium brasiliense]|nr:hypothetical protein IW01_12540 [Pectobacterium brasiliense]
MQKSLSLISEHKHAVCVSIATKPLFQYNDRLNHFIGNNFVDEWQLLRAEKMIACGIFFICLVWGELLLQV